MRRGEDLRIAGPRVTSFRLGAKAVVSFIGVGVVSEIPAHTLILLRLDLKYRWRPRSTNVFLLLFVFEKPSDGLCGESPIRGCE